MRERNLKERTATTTNSTVNYDLPQWNGEDVTNWMTNLNDAFNKIDSAMWENHTAMAGYDKIASDLQKLADDLRVDNSEIREALGIIQRGMAQQLTELNQAKQAIANANIAITQLQQGDNALSAMVEDLRDDIGSLTTVRTIKNEDGSPLFTAQSDGGVELEINSLILRKTGTAGIEFKATGLHGKSGTIRFSAQFPEELKNKIDEYFGRTVSISTTTIGIDYSASLYLRTADARVFDSNIQIINSNISNTHSGVSGGNYYLE